MPQTNANLVPENELDPRLSKFIGALGRIWHNDGRPISFYRAIELTLNESTDTFASSVFQKVYDGLRQGENLSGAMSQQPQHFSEKILKVVRSSEQIGELRIAFSQLGTGWSWELGQ